MSARKYIIKAKDRVLRRKARQQEAADKLQSLIQEKTPPIFDISKFGQAFESIVKNIDDFIRQLQTQSSFNTAKITEFMSEKAIEVKTLRTNLPRSRSTSTTEFKRELKVYEKMVLGFADELAQELVKSKALLEKPQKTVKPSLRLSM